MRRADETHSSSLPLKGVRVVNNGLTRGSFRRDKKDRHSTIVVVSCAFQIVRRVHFQYAERACDPGDGMSFHPPFFVRQYQ